MAGGVPQTVRLCRFVAFTSAAFASSLSVSVNPALAQSTTVVLNAPNTQVVDTMIRNGSYVNVNNDGPLLLTRFSTEAEWERRTIFTIDTGSIPSGSAVTSAVLTLTVKSGLGAAGTVRPVVVYRLTNAFTETQATWNSRQTGVAWNVAGGDLAERQGTFNVTNTAGARVPFNITGLVQQAVNGAYGTRQVRLALVDAGGGVEKDSYREYHSSEAATVANRPSLSVTYGATNTNTIDVPAGGDLQQALNSVARGGTIRLASGATYVGNFTLPAKSGTSYITITTGGVTLPSATARIDPSYRTSLATIRSPNEAPALSTAPSASYYRVVGVAFAANQNGAGDIIALGESLQTSLSTVPHHLELDRVLVSGDTVAGQKRGISANATDVVIMNSDIREIKAAGQDSQAICAWNTPGRITVRNNYLEAAGENMMIGGAEIKLPSPILPSDILVENNFMTKNPAWRGTSWTVKNIFELKSGRRVTVRRNLFEYNWNGAQAGFGIVFTPRNSSSRNAWITIEDVDFVENVVRHSGSAFNILGHDDSAQTGQLARLLIKNNIVHDISSTAWGGAGIFAQLGGEPRDVTIDHNTILHNGNIITFYFGTYYNSSNVKVTAAPMQGFVFTNNFAKHNSYGMFGSGQGYGNSAINYYAPGAIIRRNVVAGGSASRYPPDNFFPATSSFLPSFLNPSLLDFRLVPGSAYKGAGTDGLDVGCAIEAVFAMAESE
jgi:hypothetical protein